MKTLYPSRISFAAYLLGLLIFLNPSVYSQVTTGTITGTVTDPNGAVIPGAVVKITQTARNVGHALTTNGQGIYEANFLPVGSYEIIAERTGFKKTVVTGLVLTVGQVMRVNITLDAGEVGETVEVLAGASQALKLETSEIGQVINERQVADLPLNGRNFADLIPLNAGVTTGAQRQANSGYNFNGSRPDQNMFLIEGVDNVNINNNLLISPSLDSIQEFQVLTGTFSAEYGRSAGGIVTVKLKSGANRFSGSLFEFVRNDIFDANGYFNNQVRPTAGETKAPRAALRRNQFGGALGGPIVKDKTFFFVSYQGLRERVGKSTIQSVPTLLERQGDFTQTLAPGKALFKNALLGQTYPGCDLNNFSAACQKIPAAAIDPAARKIANLYPAPNVAGTFIPGQGTLNNFIIAGKAATDYNQFETKIDHKLTGKDTLSAHYAFYQSKSVTPAAFGGGTVGPCIDCGVVIDLLAGFPQARSQSLGLTEIHTFSSSMVNEFRTGLSRSSAFQQTSDGGKNLADEIGIPNVNVSPQTTGLPWFFFSPSPSWTGTSPFTPNINGYTTYQFTDNLVYLRDKHQLKMGFDVRRRLNNGAGNFFGKGAYIFVPFFTGNAFADFMTGRALVIQQDLTPGTVGLRGIEYGGYFQDDYKVNPRLTLNLGIRYELYPGYVEVNDRISNLDVQAGKVILAGLNGAPRQFVETDKNNFGPRVGFALGLTKKANMVLRGGYGISYSNYADSIGKAGLNPPYTQAFNQFNLSAAAEAIYKISDGLPTQLSINPGNFDPTKPVGSYRQIEASARNPYTQYYSLNIQRALPSNLVIEVGYVGTKGTKLPGELEGNPIPPGPPATAEQRRIHRNTIPNVGSITLFINAFSSVYHSLQVKAEKRLSGGFQFLTTYTLSKSIDNLNGSALTGGGDGNPSAKPQNPFNLASDRGLSGFDRRQRLVSAFGYDLPFGKGKAFGGGWNPALNGILGGWQINGILTLSSGLPFNVFATSSASCGCSANDMRANRIADGRLPKDQRGPGGWFDKSAFTDPVGTYGNSGRNIIPGPGYANFDFSLFKKIKLGERHQIQLRAEFFNIFNHTNFLNPDSIQNATWQSGGVLTRAFPARIGQFAIKYSF